MMTGMVIAATELRRHGQIFRNGCGRNNGGRRKYMRFDQYSNFGLCHYGSQSAVLSATPTVTGFTATNIDIKYNSDDLADASATPWSA